MAVEIGLSVVQQGIAEIIQPSSGGNARLQLSNGAGGGISWVGEQRETILFSLLVHFLESSNRHQHFASHLEVRGDTRLLERVLRDRKRDGPHGADIQSYIFALTAIASRYAANQLSAFAVKGQGHTVQLQFANIFDFLLPTQVMDTAFPIAQLVFAIGVVEREHGGGMPDLQEAFARFSAYALTGRVGGYQIRVLSFQLDKLVHQLIEFCVGNLRIIEYVIAVLVMTDLLTQAFNLLGQILTGDRHDEKIIFGPSRSRGDAGDQAQPLES